jgi:hypothetical protein
LLLPKLCKAKPSAQRHSVVPENWVDEDDDDDDDEEDKHKKKEKKEKDTDSKRDSNKPVPAQKSASAKHAPPSTGSTSLKKKRAHHGMIYDDI